MNPSTCGASAATTATTTTTSRPPARSSSPSDLNHRAETERVWQVRDFCATCAAAAVAELSAREKLAPFSFYCARTLSPSRLISIHALSVIARARTSVRLQGDRELYARENVVCARGVTRCVIARRFVDHAVIMIDTYSGSATRNRDLLPRDCYAVCKRCVTCEGLIKKEANVLVIKLFFLLYPVRYVRCNL